MQRRIYTSLASALAALSITASCAAPDGDEKRDRSSRDEGASVRATTSALTSTPSTTLYRDVAASGCVCPSRNGGGYSNVVDYPGYSASVTKPFTEALPAAARVTGIQVIGYGSGCGSPVVNVSVDEIAIGTLNPGDGCDCGECVQRSVSLSNPNGIPGFVVDGSHTITLAVGAFPEQFAVSAVDVVFTYDNGATSTTLSTTTNPSVFGQSLTFTAHVIASGPNASQITGRSVDFVDGGGTLFSTTLNGAGDATFTTAALPVGSHALQASFLGGDSFGSSSSTTLSQVVNKALTSTTLGSSVNPTVIHGSTTLTATVTPTAPGAGTPSGGIEFFDGTTSLGTASISGGAATLPIASLGVGHHSLSAVYAGDGSFEASTSNSVSQQVAQDGTTTKVESNLNPSTFGAPVTFTATVSANGSGETPTGDVTFSEAGNVLGIATLDGSGVATFTTSSFSAGDRTIVGTYGGDTHHEAGSTGSIEQKVNGAVTKTELATSGTPARHGQTVTLTATVTSAIAGTIDGTVTFIEGGSELGTSTISNGTATLVTSALGTASHDIVAVYNGVPNFATSATDPLTQSVIASDTTTTLLASSNPSAVGSSVTFTATVAAVSPGAGTPTGTVTFKEGSQTLATATLATGEATFSTSAMPVGTHVITAEYGTTTDFNASTSAPHAQTVASLAAAASLTSAPNPSKVKSAVILTATIESDGGVPSGEVTFVDLPSGADAGTTLGSAVLDAGIAALSVTTLGVGNHALHAQYGGDPTYGTTTAEVAHVVTKVATMTAIASSPNPSQAGQSVSLTATVSSELAGFAGNVDFFDGTTKLGTSALSGATATLAVPSFTIGGHVLSAVYAGDALHVGSTSSALTQNVGQDAGANQTTDAGTTQPTTPDASADAGIDRGFDAAFTVDGGGCGCSTVPARSSLALIPSIALFAGLALRRRSRKSGPSATR